MAWQQDSDSCTSCLETWIMEISVHRVSREPVERATNASQSDFCLVFSLIIFQAMTAKSVWPPHSKSACSQALFYVWSIHSSGHGSVCRRYVGFSPASKESAMLSQSKHWSGSRRVCQTCSASPVVRYTDSTGVVVSADVGCLVGHSIVNFYFLILTQRKVVG